ncbi:hypothetical protein F441_23060 [Phytophthora nicotianae CJ01A1]|uniref:Uncharacterized protein n=4 Tax=Phytophthora nicotianae TaxID=4792 RepID=W2ZKX6_PHYNI|nr:hypothetical protein L915_21802 [Phytophthora nicotianae]ETL77410.1 hypothetical protein L917_21646 [Phytophthora nicotianae]ETO78708.1 hypothetical protein F444_06432 [Phytophthora nicotianae P1976]ETO99523.1 hypothetical protein F441_23060 [Phytophthora nicotianae CJ01A1]ETP47690.1 hypothetical protein F442_06412 [Phytophthora nicotianae P10297]
MPPSPRGAGRRLLAVDPLTESAGVNANGDCVGYNSQLLVSRNDAKKRRIDDDNADSEWSKDESESSASEEESAGFAGSGIVGSTPLVECPGLSTTIFGTWKAFSEYF